MIPGSYLAHTRSEFRLRGGAWGESLFSDLHRAGIYASSLARAKRFALSCLSGRVADAGSRVPKTTVAKPLGLCLLYSSSCDT